jgi:signal transduction histidine kinase
VRESEQHNRPGNGLLNMRRRIEDIGGRFELHSQAGQGTRIIVELDT